MKKLSFLFFVIAVVVGFNVYAEGNGTSVPSQDPIADEPEGVYACWWSGEDKDCVEHGEIGCICED